MPPSEKTKNLGSDDTGERTSNGQGSKRICLSKFIQDNVKEIVDQWEAFARTLAPSSADMTPLALRDHIHQILDFIVGDIDSFQTSLDQIEKSQGRKAKSSIVSAAEIHAALRLAGGFDIEQMVSEYRALRASVVRLWSRMNDHMDASDIDDLTRFNESIDQQLSESVSHYTDKVTQSNELFVGILGHDLRSPLQTVTMCAELIVKLGALSDRQTMLATQIVESGERISRLITDLLDVTRARLGAGLPIIRIPMDMGYVGRLMVDEMRAAHPTRSIILDVSGDLKGDWDQARIGQVFSNLLGNAIQYGFQDAPINVVVEGVSSEVILSVHNEGASIPPEKIGTIFKSLTRAVGAKGDHPASDNLGLGLFITQDIITSHGGTIHVTSSGEAGTTFVVSLPRHDSGARLPRAEAETGANAYNPAHDQG